MMKKVIFAFLFALGISTATSAQNNAVGETRPLKVAIFAPLYLDSAFNNNSYKYGKTFAKFTQPGFDFVQGAIVALDSLSLPKGSVEAYIYDSKSETESVPWLINNNKLDSVDLIIGSVKDLELSKLSAFSKEMNIPFISATSPNDGGTVANPFFVMLNASLRGHCESIHSFLVQNHGTDKIYLCRKFGAQEDKIEQYFKTINEADGNPLLNIEYINFENDFASLKNKLDSNRSSVIIGASLNEDFANNLTKAIYQIKDDYPLELIGMPNWETFEDLKKSSVKDLPIIYTNAYYNTKGDFNSRKIQAAYNKKFNGNPTEMVFKGYEVVYTFVKLLSRYKNDFNSHLNESALKMYSEFNFKPVYLRKGTNMPDYFENKHLFLLKILNGKVSKF
jgi:Periplasmic binding protein